MERAVLGVGTVAERLVLDAHLARQTVEEVVCDPRYGSLASSIVLMVVLAVQVNR